ncbi:protein phosphatase 2, regulatory subunit B, gamma [Pteropus alecto]|uniref:protein phosphatase 2, regulatory subunit B, gamma n=1 Tax=Pteropus alecto TaxID=9402 RepID=UPI000D535BC9|nr:protein phosphatase 2, regulatory subunit B, gamma [Pteropus alecto]
MGEDTDTRKINHSFLRDHSYVTEADIISTVEFNHTGELLATGDKGGRVVIFQREPEMRTLGEAIQLMSKDQGLKVPEVLRLDFCFAVVHQQGTALGAILPRPALGLGPGAPPSMFAALCWSVLASRPIIGEILLEIDNTLTCARPFDADFSVRISREELEKGAKCAVYRDVRGTSLHKTIKLWKITERDKRPEGYNLKDEEGKLKDLSTVTSLQVPVLKPMDLMVEVSPRRVFANGHTYHINSISVNSDCETYMSADDLRINLWHLAVTDRSFNIVDIKPANMEDLTEVITASEFHPHHCNLFVYSSSKGSLRLCDMRAAALCDKHAKLFEEPEDPSNRSFFSEITSSVSDVKFSHSGRYMLTRDYLTVKVWDLNMEARPIETYQVHDYLRSKLCSLYENDCIFDKFECAWNGSDSKPRAVLKPRRVCVGGKRRRDDISVDSLDFSKKILHTAWHPAENIIAIAATNNLYIFQDKVNSEMH